MAQIVIGPLLRYVSRDSATIWVETDEPCEVRVLDTVTSTFSVWGHHYALVVLRGSGAGELHSLRRHTRRGAALARTRRARIPPSAIRTLGGDESVRVLFGSCRAAAPHEAPFDLEPADDERGIGVDALPRPRAANARPTDRRVARPR